MSEVIVYSKAGCGQCMGVKMFLKQNNIPHEIRDIADPSNREEFDKYGVQSLPLVVPPVGEVHTGFVPNTLQSIKEGMGV
ncbi:glutaredoxin family protein [Enterococcus mundtii]|uniref:glutaredoxin family protein n=1 Tax=Enterococcus mundtii TaxID=53346 RepID=UPI001A956978|nr:glutaredoxin family protein [Enterococcus mundtii]MBO1087212.1 glutaredoxin family protein [Enterococcus mundtii]